MKNSVGSSRTNPKVFQVSGNGRLWGNEFLRRRLTMQIIGYEIQKLRIYQYYGRSVGERRGEGKNSAAANKPCQYALDFFCGFWIVMRFRFTIVTQLLCY
jgi:hypothetical protein